MNRLGVRPRPCIQQRPTQPGVVYPRPLKQRYNLQNGDKRLTVCVAAICQGGRIIGVSDRMLTAGDIEFEPSTMKVWQLTSSIFALIAGDSTLQSAILHDVEIAVTERVVTDPTNWWRVRDVVELYTGSYREIKRRHAENALLSPLGMDVDSFSMNQADMDSDVVSKLVHDLTFYDLPDVHTIFAGIDTDGPRTKNGEQRPYPHLYVTHGDKEFCYDQIGFAAIGIGDWHAQSQLMFAKHTRTRPFPESLLLAYSAKKHAEVAPGVGVETDMFSIGPALGANFVFGRHVVAGLERIYRETRVAIEEITVQAEKKARNFIDEILSGSTQEQPQSTPTRQEQPTPESTTDDPKPAPPLPE